MGLPRTFVGFSSTDIRYYRMMLAWKSSEHIDFDFVDCQLRQEIHSDSESYVKAKCRERINMAGTFILLIGEDTRSKHKYVRWEIEVAIEKNCRIICVNLDGSRALVPGKCPPILQGIGALFVAFNAKIIAHALNKFDMKESGDWVYSDKVYQSFGLD